MLALLPRAQRGAMARTDYSTRGNKDALSIQGSAVQSEVGGQPLELRRGRENILHYSPSMQLDFVVWDNSIEYHPLQEDKNKNCK